MDLLYNAYIMIGGRFFYTIDEKSGAVLTCSDSRYITWFTPDKAERFKQMLEEAGVSEVEVFDGSNYLQMLNAMYQKSEISKSSMLSMHKIYQGVDKYAV